MEEYVIGFLFSRDFKSVLLIRKNKPDWQRGKLNGVGGKIEKDETPLDAITREFKEETGLIIKSWSLKVKMATPDCSLYFFAAVGDLAYTKNMTDEKLLIYQLTEIPVVDTIYNLKWLLPLCFEPTVIFPVVISLLFGMDRVRDIPLQI